MLIENSGGGSTTVAAVHDGYVLQKVLLLLYTESCVQHFLKEPVMCPGSVTSVLAADLALYFLTGWNKLKCFLKAWEIFATSMYPTLGMYSCRLL